ncbi:MAG: hypothetical protein IT244_10510 [Bacteroidia bacterium]|nr:hypothetical protein [Bacteroidia bacterium]
MKNLFVYLSFVFVVLSVSSCKKKNDEDPNLAFKSLGTLAIYSGASPSAPYVMLQSHSLSLSKGYLGLQNCENPQFPGPFISDSTMQVGFLGIFRDQDNKSIIVPYSKFTDNDPTSTSYWIDVSENGKLTKLASFERNSEFKGLRFCGIKDGYLWAIGASAADIQCYNLNLAKGKHVADISSLLVCSFTLEGIIGEGYAIEKDGVLFVAGNTGIIYCIDVTNRSNPTVLNVIREQGCEGLEVSGNLMLSKANYKLLIMDIGDARNPAIKSRLLGKWGDAKFHNGYLYTGFQEMKVFDMGNPAKPKLLKNLSNAPYEISDFKFSGEYIFCEARTYPYFTPGTYPFIIKGNKF